MIDFGGWIVYHTIAPHPVISVVVLAAVNCLLWGCAVNRLLCPRVTK
jgi:hypothetical protein